MAHQLPRQLLPFLANPVGLTCPTYCDCMLLVWSFNLPILSLSQYTHIYLSLLSLLCSCTLWVRTRTCVCMTSYSLDMTGNGIPESSVYLYQPRRTDTLHSMLSCLVPYKLSTVYLTIPACPVGNALPVNCRGHCLKQRARWSHSAVRG